MPDVYKPLPPALRSMIALLENKTTYHVSSDVPKSRPDKFVRLELLGGPEDASGTIASPAFAAQCYALDVGSAEDLCGELIALLKNAQFLSQGPVQFRKYRTDSLPVSFPDPLVADRRRWQFTFTFSMSNYDK